MSVGYGSRAARPNGRQIAAARILLGMTQAELAKRSNVSLEMLCRMEASRSKAVPANLHSIASVCRVLEAAGIDMNSQHDGGFSVRIGKPNEWAGEFLDLLRRN